jgi:diguanylate cyclase (GGDEF)-like protein
MLLAVVPALVLAISAVLTPSHDSLVDLWQHVDAIRDDAGRLSLADVRAPQAPWVPQTVLPEVHTATRFHPSIEWFRLRVKRTERGDYAIIVSQHALDAVLYVPMAGGRIETRHSGGDVPAIEKEVPEQNAIVLPPDALDGRAIYLRVVSAFDHNSVFLLAGGGRWMSMRMGWDAWERPQLLFAGFVAAFGMLNVLLAVRLRRRAYAFYAGAVLAAALQVLVLTGDAWRWLWWGIGIDYDLAITVSYTLAIGFAVIFGREFLRTRRAFPRIDALVIVLLGIFVATNAMILFDPERLIVWGPYDAAESVATALVLAPVVWCAAIAARRGARDALAYMLALLGVLIGNVIGWAANNLILPLWTFFILAPTLGFAWEATLLSVALTERLRTYERDASIDPLTRLTNRRALEETLGHEMDHARRTLAPFSVLVVDIDNFKAYNDRFGHLAGDVALQLVAKIFGGALRAIDCAARFGGEEFVALLPGTDLSGALTLGERVRTALRDAAIPHPDGVDGLLTVSVGAARRIGRAADRTRRHRALRGEKRRPRSRGRQLRRRRRRGSG